MAEVVFDENASLTEIQKPREAVNLMAMLAEIPEDIRMHVLKNLESLELSNGCEGSCSFCAECTGKISKQFSFSSLQQFARMIKQKNIPFDPFVNGYGASDPLDYRDGDNNFFDFTKLFHNPSRRIDERKMIVSQSFSRVPPGAVTDFTQQVIQALKNPNAVSGHVKMSVNRSNEELAQKIYDDILKKFDPNQYPRSSVIESLSGFFVRRFGKDQPLSQLGRNFPAGVSCPEPRSIHLSYLEDEGYKITPEGIFVYLNVFPTRKNPTGRLLLKFDPENPIKIYKANYGILLSTNASPLALIAPKFNKVFFDSVVLPPEITNKIVWLREIYALQFLFDFVEAKNLVIILTQRLLKNTSLDHLQIRLVEMEKILKTATPSYMKIHKLWLEHWIKSWSLIIEVLRDAQRPGSSGESATFAAFLLSVLICQKNLTDWDGTMDGLKEIPHELMEKTNKLLKQSFLEIEKGDNTIVVKCNSDQIPEDRIVKTPTGPNRAARRQAKKRKNR